jgi:hypothetical protein
MKRLIVFLLGLLVIGPPLVAQSLADLARKEGERRKTVKEPARVLSNKDLVGTPDAATGSADAGAATAAEAGKDADPGKAAKDPKEPVKGSKEPDKGSKDAVKDQAYWSGRVKVLQMQLDRNQSYASALQTQINALATDFANRDDPAQRAKIETDRQKALAEQSRLKEAIVKDKKALSDLDDEARRAGVPPGWLR